MSLSYYLQGHHLTFPQFRWDPHLVRPHFHPNPGPNRSPHRLDLGQLPNLVSFFKRSTDLSQPVLDGICHTTPRRYCHLIFPSAISPNRLHCGGLCKLTRSRYFLGKISGSGTLPIRALRFRWRSRRVLPEQDLWHSQRTLRSLRTWEWTKNIDIWDIMWFTFLLISHHGAKYITNTFYFGFMTIFFQIFATSTLIPFSKSLWE